MHGFSGVMPVASLVFALVFSRGFPDVLHVASLVLWVASRFCARVLKCSDSLSSVRAVLDALCFL